MANEHRQQVERLVRAALEHPPSERSLFLEGACLDDASLRKEVEAVLASREPPASSPQEPHSTSRISSTIMCQQGACSLSVSERRIR